MLYAICLAKESVCPFMCLWMDGCIKKPVMVEGEVAMQVKVLELINPICMHKRHDIRNKKHLRQNCASFHRELGKLMSALG